MHDKQIELEVMSQKMLIKNSEKEEDELIEVINLECLTLVEARKAISEKFRNLWVEYAGKLN